MKNALLGVLLFILILVGGTAIAFYTGVMGNIYDSTIGKKQMDVQRQNYEHSQSFVEGQLRMLSKEEQEYNTSTDPSNKQAILDYVRQNFSDFDQNNITDPAELSFLRKALGE